MYPKSNNGFNLNRCNRIFRNVWHAIAENIQENVFFLFKTQFLYSKINQFFSKFRFLLQHFCLFFIQDEIFLFKRRCFYQKPNILCKDLFDSRKNIFIQDGIFWCKILFFIQEITWLDDVISPHRNCQFRPS